MAMYNTKLNYNGEPCTWRHVSTVRGQALGNLPQKCGKAPSAEPTIGNKGLCCFNIKSFLILFKHGDFSVN